VSLPPPNSCDCHVHVIGPKAQFPLQASRAYTPMDATSQQLTGMMGRLGIDRTVLVQPSIYGTDNSCLIEALKTIGHTRARAVVVADPCVTPETQDNWHTLGVRGIRLNLTSGSTPKLDVIRSKIASILPACERNGWHLQFFLPAAVIAELANDFARLPVPCVLDHFGLLSPMNELSPQQREHEAALVKLLDTGNAWVKLSGSYRVAEDRHHPGIAALAQRLNTVNPERMIWGSDWPHTPVHAGKKQELLDEEQPYRNIDTQALLSEFGAWFPASREQCQILVSNPEKLYQFGS